MYSVGSVVLNRFLSLGDKVVLQDVQTMKNAQQDILLNIPDHFDKYEAQRKLFLKLAVLCTLIIIDRTLVMWLLTTAERCYQPAVSSE
jgi:hypothetical protein